MKAFVCGFQILISDQPKNLNWYDGLRHLSFTWCSTRHYIALSRVTVDADFRKYFLPSFHAIFTSYHTLIYKNDETS